MFSGGIERGQRDYFVDIVKALSLAKIDLKAPFFLNKVKKPLWIVVFKKITNDNWLIAKETLRKCENIFDLC